MGRRGHREPVVVRLDRLEPRHTSGLDERGRRWSVRGAPVGAVLRVQPGRKGSARRLALLEPAPDGIAPACPVFGLCGGCQLQEMPLARQREEKARLVASLVGAPLRGIRGAPEAYGYRNKLELSWSPRRYTAAGADDAPGSYLGFHPSGWYSKVVPVAGCPLGTAAMNRVIARVAALGLEPAWDNRAHRGTWRHLVVRDAGTRASPRVLVALVTSPEATRAEVEAVAHALDEVDSVLWVVSDRVADVAEGELRAVLRGSAGLRFELGGARLHLPHDAFFQVNTAGAGLLLATVGEAVGEGGTLLDLYCGSGALGLCLAGRFDRVVGVELHERAVATARENAVLNGVAGEWHAGLVEDVLPRLGLAGRVTVVADPPRAGLHPQAAAFLAGLAADVLVYVACNPASLGRDRALLEAGGWTLTDLWAVDLFPQTHHVEAVARFARQQP